VVLAAPPAALVTAPWAATVRYAGPLPDDAIVMILEPEAGYLIVLAGLAAAYVEAGAVVEAGAALGLLGGRDPAAGEFVAAAREGGVEMRETLYVELRHGDVAVDPSEWFTPTQE
jgi:septal ring factor EnvC (AmiA/AmiB activator)